MNIDCKFEMVYLSIKAIAAENTHIIDIIITVKIEILSISFLGFKFLIFLYFILRLQY
ncbi:MAG: hypothetical protein WH035_06565 [Spirochaetota bacterium]